MVPAALSEGLVVGAGWEKDVAKNAAIRFEVLHQRRTDAYFGWGDDGDSTTSARAALLLKF